MSARTLPFFALLLSAALIAGCDDGSPVGGAYDDPAGSDGGAGGFGGEGGGHTGNAADAGRAPEPEPEPGLAPPPAADRGEAEPPPPPPGDDLGMFEEAEENPFVDTADDPLSTFSVDTDTASYTLMRRALLERGVLPPAASVRLEEYLNFFKYAYPAPAPGDAEPFAIHLEGAPSPFGEGLHLLRIGIKGLEIPEEERDPANLVFLVDVSGSMRAPDKIGLVKFSLARLLDGLRPSDTVAIVTYAGADAVVLEPTPVARRAEILDAVDAFEATGSTNGAAGIRTAYALAQDAFREGGINRVVLCTDGDFNVGVRGEELVQLVESWRDQRIFLTVLGYGLGNLNDAFIEELTNRGEGNYAYVDSQNEALRVLGERLVGTLQVIAKDVKIQVEFDPEAVQRFRLVGYENRVLEHDDFRDDTVDAGEIGSGHSVTAFYEVELIEGAEDKDVATVRVRHKPPEGGESAEVEFGLPIEAVHGAFDDASVDLRFAAAVAEFGEILRHSMHSEGGAGLEQVRALALATDPAPESDRGEFVRLVEMALELWPAEAAGQ